MKIPCGVADHNRPELEEFENEDFTLKTHEMFSVYTKSEELKKGTITGHFGFVFENTDTKIIVRPPFSIKLCFFETFSFYTAT